MSKPFYVKFEVSKDIIDKAYQIIQISSDSGKIKKGTNETTKAIERGVSKLVLVAEDVEPPQIVAHIPLLCEERKTPYLFVPTKIELGKASGLEVGCSAISIIDGGEAKETLEELIETAMRLQKGEGGKGE